MMATPRRDRRPEPAAATSRLDPQNDGAGLLVLQRRAGNRAVARLAARSGRVVFVQRLEVSDLTDGDSGKWFALPDATVAMAMRKHRGAWVFRVKDDALGPRYVTLAAGRIVPMPNFTIVIAREYGNDPNEWFSDKGEITSRGEQASAQSKRVRAETSELVQMSHDDLVDIGTTTAGANEVGVDAYDQTVIKVGETVWTDGMGPCITVGATGVYAGRRMNVLHHSFTLGRSNADFGDIGRRIVADIDAKLRHATGGNLSDLVGLRFFVVGGDQSTAGKMEAIVTLLLFNTFPIGGVADTTHEGEGHSTKAFIISADGIAGWAHKENPKKVEKVTSPNEFKGFGTFKSAGGGGYGFSGGGGGFKVPSRTDKK